MLFPLKCKILTQEFFAYKPYPPSIFLKLLYPGHTIFLLFHGNFLFTLRVFARNLLRRNRQSNTFCILVWCLAWHSNSGFSSNKPTHNLLDQGDFKETKLFKLRKANIVDCRFSIRNQFYEIVLHDWVTYSGWDKLQLVSPAEGKYKKHCMKLHFAIIICGWLWILPSNGLGVANLSK